VTDKTVSVAGQAAPSPRKRRSRGWLECDLGILLGIGGLVAGRLGQLWIAFDVFAQFTLQFALLTAAFAAGRLMPRGRLAAAMLLILVGLVGIGAWPQIAALTSPLTGEPKPGEKAVKVASFNTWYENRQVDAVGAELRRINADIVTVVEFGRNKHKLLDDLKDVYPYQANCFSEDYCFMAILSKFPILSAQAKVGWEGAPLLMAHLGPEAGDLTVFAVHTIRFPHSRAQFRQVRALADLIDLTPGPKLVMGDFNATPFSRITSTLANQTGLARLTMLPSWPSWVGLPQMAIDHIFVSPGIGVIAGERLGEPAGSDHFPITMTLAVPAEQNP